MYYYSKKKKKKRASNLIRLKLKQIVKFKDHYSQINHHLSRYIQVNASLVLLLLSIVYIINMKFFRKITNLQINLSCMHLR